MMMVMVTGRLVRSSGESLGGWWEKGEALGFRVEGRDGRDGRDGREGREVRSDGWSQARARASTRCKGADLGEEGATDERPAEEIGRRDR